MNTDNRMALDSSPFGRRDLPLGRDSTAPNVGDPGEVSARTGNTLAPPLKGEAIAAGARRLVDNRPGQANGQNAAQDGPEDEDGDTDMKANAMAECLATIRMAVEKFRAAHGSMPNAAAALASASAPAMDSAGLSNRFPGVDRMRVLGGHVIRSI